MIHASISFTGDTVSFTGSSDQAYPAVGAEEAYSLIRVVEIPGREHRIIVSFAGHFPVMSEGSCSRVSSEDAVFLRAIASMMLTELQGTFALRAEILKRLLKIFIARVCQAHGVCHEQEAAGKRAALARQFQRLLEVHFTTRKMVSEYAEMLQVTTNYLNCVIRLVSGYPASFHIHQRVVQEAKRQAVEERRSMKEIAYRLGFPDQSHFSKYFRKNCGKRFIDFRKEVTDSAYKTYL